MCPMRIRAWKRGLRLLRGGNGREVATIVSGIYPTLLSQFAITEHYHNLGRKVRCAEYIDNFVRLLDMFFVGVCTQTTSTSTSGLCTIKGQG